MNINIVETVGLLTRCSFDEKYRDPIISLGGVQTLAELLLVRPKLSSCLNVLLFSLSDGEQTPPVGDHRVEQL